MAKLRIGIVHGPDDLAGGQPPGTRPGRKTDVQEVSATLERAEHEVFSVVVDGSRDCLMRLAKVEADLLFNLVEGFGQDDTKEPFVAAYYELLGLRYTGSGPRGLSLAMDKALSKKVLQFHGVRTPKFVTVHRGRVGWAHDLEFPVIVKPAREDGSVGIGFSAVVGSIKELMERIHELHADFDHPVIIEEYIEGREVSLGVIGNEAPETFPPVELDLSHLPEGTPRIAGAEVKWQEGTQAYRGSRYRIPEDLPGEALEAMQATALTGFRALHLRDYARFDFRVPPDRGPYLLEANANPYLHSGADYIKGARASGRTHPQTILEIVGHAMSRYGLGS